jgi:hypothetical protein
MSKRLTHFDEQGHMTSQKAYDVPAFRQTRARQLLSLRSVLGTIMTSLQGEFGAAKGPSASLQSVDYGYPPSAQDSSVGNAAASGSSR